MIVPLSLWVYLRINGIALALSKVNPFVFRAEMALGGALGGGVIILYYINKYRHGQWNSKDGKNFGSTILAVIMFVVMVLIV